MKKTPKLFVALFFASLIMSSCNFVAPSNNEASSTSGQPTGTTTSRPTPVDPDETSSGSISSKTSSSKPTSSSKTSSSTTTTTTSGDTPPTPQDPIAVTNPKTTGLYYIVNDDSESFTAHANVTVYQVSTQGDIPYVKFNDFYNNIFVNFFIGSAASSYYTFTSTKVGDGIYRFYNPTYPNNMKFLVNTYADTLQFERDDVHSFDASSRVGGIALIANGIDTNYVSINTTKSKTIHEQEFISYDFARYGIDIVYDSSNNVYFPLQTVIDMLFAANCYTLVYNGKNLYYAGQISSEYPNFYNHYVNNATADYLNAATRSTKMAEFTYNELCFAIEHFYGLYSQLNTSYASMDAYFNAKSLKTRLKSTSSSTYESALAEFVGKYYYDGHSGYLEPSLMVYSTKSTYKNSYSNYRSSNARSVALDNAITANYTARYNAGKNGTYFEIVGGDTAIIRFDSFMKYNLNDWTMSDIETYILDNDTQYPYATLHSISTDLVFLKAFKSIKENSSIKNIVVDITCNGGGMADSIPWLEAFFTDDPSMSCYNSVTKEITEVHYNVDLNRDGVVNSNDTYKGKGYKFFLMTSSYSFSCGNYFPTVIKERGAMTIIGQRSGGGECVVGYLTTATGSVLRNSGCYHLGYYDYTQQKYIGNDGGIPVDYSFTDFYNVSALRTFCNSH